jgi:hypothetical protein
MTRPALWILFATFALPVVASAQTPFVAPRIREPIDESALTTLGGNTHSLARAEFDRGVVPPDFPMERVLLLLKPSPQQSSDLQELLGEQQDKSSANYHRWLTPDEFGQRFGAADQDIQQVTNWLSSHRLQSIRVSRGRTVIEFSGTAAAVEEAFHVSIRHYVVSGEEHWANSSDPQIPTALAPVVAGPFTIHNFVKKPQMVRSNLPFAGSITPGLKPRVTSSSGINAIGPQDFAVLYNSNPLYTSQPPVMGNGARIAVVGRSNVSNQDLFDFRSVFFGSNNVNSALVRVNGIDPGNLGGDEEVEALLDASWAGVAAPDAAVTLVVSASTASTDGLDLSELYIIDNNIADVMTESFGFCEGEATSVEADATSLLAQQASAQGITYLVAAGDSGASGCDASPTATHPVSVSLPASTPYAIAVGGTQFNEMGNNGLYWNSQASLKSAISYIPEDAWNESCLSGSCPPGTNPIILAGGGGASIFFPKPAWQSGVPGIPAQNARYIPDVSLSAAGHDPYLICLHRSCEPDSQGQIHFEGVFGTSVSAQAFGGVIALIVQKTGSRQGQANFSLYKLAAAEALAQCNASSSPALASSGACVFNDVTIGNNAVPGETGYGTPNAAYQSGAGYDLATGLGSVNIANLVNAWSSAQFTSSLTTLLINNGQSMTFTHGQSVPITISVTPKSPGPGTPTGYVGLNAGDNADQGFGLFVLNNGSVSTNTDLLPGGTYQVRAHYDGDSTFGGSDSSLSPTITVSPEASKTTMAILTFDSSGHLTNSNASTVSFGSRYVLHVDLTNAQGTTCLPAAEGGPVCPGFAVTMSDTINGQKGQLDAGAFFPDAFGLVEDDVIQLSVGTHVLEADYSGDKNFNRSSATLTVVVTPLAVTVSEAPTVVNTTVGGSAKATVTLSAQGGFDPIVFSCAGLPPLSSCSFSPSSLNTSGQTTLTISTAASSISVVRFPEWPSGFWTASAAALAFAMLFTSFFFSVPDRRWRVHLRVGRMLACAWLVGALAACGGAGGGSSGSTNQGGTTGGTPKGQYSVVIAATGTGFTQTAILTLNVQ